MAQFTVLREETFDDILASLESLKTQVEAWRDKAQEWAENDEDVAVESGQFSAKHHALKADGHRLAAVAAKLAAQAAQLAAETEAGDADTARIAAEAAQTAAELAQGIAESEAADATTARIAAEAAQSAAEAAEAAAVIAKNDAETAKNEAVTAKNDAEAAAGIAVQGIHVIGRLANTGALPGSPTTGDAYVIENSGTSQDEIHVWDGAQWIVFSVGSGTSWGQIGGTLADQVDLKNALDAKLPAAEKGSANGVAELDGSGKVPSTQLPAFVDDVLEFANLASFPGTGETGKLYTALDTNKVYRWGGSAYIEVSESLALGETSGSAYRGDRGKTAYDHSQESGNPHGTTAAQVGADTSSQVNDKVESAKNEESTTRTSGFTLALADTNREDRFTSATAQMVTIPTHASEAFPNGYWRVIRQAGAGQITVTGASGVTVNGNTKTADQHTAIMVKKISDNIWDCYGGVE
jgi:hypothetical protein